MADVVGRESIHLLGPHLEEDIKRVHMLLENAPADRAWRRRGFLVICRSRLPKIRTERSSVPVVMTGSSAQEQLLETNERKFQSEDTCRIMGMGDTGDKRSSVGSISSVVGWALGLAEEGVFRAIAKSL